MSNNAHIVRNEPSIFVYQAPVRVWHWTNALAITVLALTGYFIGSPMSSLPGEASDHFLMGYIRFIHFSAGFILGLAFILRIYWFFVGNATAKEIFLHNILKRTYWSELLHEVRWYLFLEEKPRLYKGHNPLAIFMMHWLFIWPVIFMIFTGFALYGEGTGAGSLIHQMFTSWMIPLFGSSFTIHTWHHYLMWVIILFVMIHVYVAIREDIMSRQSIISSMISGWRNFKDDGKLEDDKD
jgi:Ni/Fe-hydrogenase 1 B-type cytochrome subunit